MGNFFTKKCKCDCQSETTASTTSNKTTEPTNTQLLLEINELKKQNECLKSLNEKQTKLSLNILKSFTHSNPSVDETHQTAKSTTTPTTNTSTTNDKLKHISIDAIEQYVDGMIADTDVNITYLPDFVERQLYKNILKMVLGLLDNILSNSHVTVFNHEINFELVPLKKFDGENNESEKPE